jgi:GT2 family glycosyltransferase
MDKKEKAEALSEEGKKKNNSPWNSENELIIRETDNISLPVFFSPPFLYKYEYTLSDFLQYNYEDFIKYSFKAILKREASAKEKERYIKLLESGKMYKHQVIEELRYSSEGIKEHVKIKGLYKRFLFNKIFRIPLIGRMLEIISIIVRLPEIFRYIRGIDDTNIQRFKELTDKTNSLSKALEDYINKKLQYNSNYLETLYRQIDEITCILNHKAYDNNIYEQKKILNEKIDGLKSLLHVIKNDNIKARDAYEIWIKKHEPGEELLEKQKHIIFPYAPEISLITFINNTKKEYVTSMIRSIISQTYARWELYIIHNSDKDIENIIDHPEKDRRIKTILSKSGKGEALNETLSVSKGDFIIFPDSSDLLAPFAFFEIVKTINEYPETDFIYSDEDTISEDGNSRTSPYFKPDWSPDTLRSFNYINHIYVLRKDLIKKIAPFREIYKESQNYDIILRASEKAKNIFHIPSVLYHCRHRTTDNETCKETDKKILKDHLNRTGLDGNVEDGLLTGTYKVTYKIKHSSKLSILIPGKDHKEDLKKCITSIIDKSSYKYFEIIIIDTGSSGEETFSYYEELEKLNFIKIIKWEKPFNYAACNNFAIDYSTGEMLLFLNNDTEIINSDWIERMVEHVQRKEVGAAGAKLYYSDRTVQHAGMVMCFMEPARHIFRHSPEDSPGYFGRLKIIQNLSFITGGCLMVRKEVFKEVGGFDERFAMSFNDTDLCLKIREKGYVNIWTPYGELYHYEGKTRGPLDTTEKQELFRREHELFIKKWKDLPLKEDPYFNPNLTLKEDDFFLLKEEGERRIYRAVGCELKG